VTSKLRATEQDGIVTFEVRVTPRASRSRVVAVQDGMLKVALTAAPVEGAANRALVELLAKTFGVSKSSVEIVRGERGRTKLVRVQDADLDRLGLDD
jgi:uncharacterized protein (TIGR00251 family)